MTEEEKLAEYYVRNKADKGNFDLEQFGKAYFSESSMKQAFLAGYEQGIGRLRFCCTCKKWKECWDKAEPYGICADWEIKE